MAAFVTDLDGTLLTSEQRLTDYTVRVLTEAMEQGVIVSFATARGYVSAASVVSEIAWRFPVILYNGALIYDTMNRQVVDGYWLDAVISGEIIETGRRSGITPFHFTMNDRDEERVFHEPPARAGDVCFYNSRLGDKRFRETDKLEVMDGHRTLVITYIGLLEELQPVYNAVHERFGAEIQIHFIRDLYIEDHYFLEFSHPKGNKSDGLKLWARHLGLETKDILVFGDHLNDLGLFAAAGTRVAVQNAHEELKMLADTVTASNNENGVAVFLEKTLKRERC
ncbi:Cof-type HAD-IIB family hydrolase [Paenibacillus sp. PK3_47]|uniref:Cof-type HAD-IIB family hydrolase n=1 Tax=Paenibacillus sp. PK3_47 TaxID=2072642 RepID=UPI00201E45CF|nr:Cof-type HAD-IIB family hydrolase [Paenibacillus sp. PK3_47]